MKQKPWDSERALNNWQNLPEAERAEKLARQDDLLWSALNIAVMADGQAKRSGQNWKPVPSHSTTL